MVFTIPNIPHEWDKMLVALGAFLIAASLFSQNINPHIIAIGLVFIIVGAFLAVVKYYEGRMENNYNYCDEDIPKMHDNAVVLLFMILGMFAFFYYIFVISN